MVYYLGRLYSMRLLYNIHHCIIFSGSIIYGKLMVHGNCIENIVVCTNCEVLVAVYETCIW